MSTHGSVSGRRSRQNSNTSTNSTASEGDSSVIVNRSGWVPNDEEQAEIDRMNAEFEEYEKVVLKVEYIDRSGEFDERSIVPSKSAHDLSANIFTPLSAASKNDRSGSFLSVPPARGIRPTRTTPTAARVAEEWAQDLSLSTARSEDKHTNNNERTELNGSLVLGSLYRPIESTPHTASTSSTSTSSYGIRPVKRKSIAAQMAEQWTKDIGSSFTDEDSKIEKDENLFTSTPKRSKKSNEPRNSLSRLNV